MLRKRLPYILRLNSVCRFGFIESLRYVLDNSEIIETLLDQKVNLNLKDSHGETPVFYAVKKGNLELAQVIITTFWIFISP